MKSLDAKVPVSASLPGRHSCCSFLDRSRGACWAILVAGLLIPQFVLYGSSLTGARVLLPLDILTMPGVYLPPTPGATPTPPHDRIVSDLVFLHPVRNYAAQEIRAGRLPLWEELSYAGAPFAMFGKYDPFEWLYVAAPIPITLAWMQLAKALVAGLGAFQFFRRAIGVRALPALIGSWCFPLAGYFVYWQGFSLTTVLAWFPWLLLAVWAVVQRPGGWGLLGLAVATTLTLVAAHVDVAGQALLASGLYAVMLLATAHLRPLRRIALVRGAIALIAGWSLGFALGAPYWLPVIEYSRTGDRVARRAGGKEERPPAGLSVLPQLLIPAYYGTTQEGSAYFGKTGNMPESAATAYAGLIAALWAAPLAWTDARRRRLAWFWLAMAMLGLAWQLDIPGVVDVLRLPGFNLFSHNRYTFLFAFAVLALAVIGLDRLAEGPPARRRWFLAPAAATVVVAFACLSGLLETPAELGAWIAEQVGAPRGRPSGAILDLAQKIRPAFERTYAWGLAFAAVAAVGWVLAARSRPFGPWLIPLFGLAMVAELTVTAWDVNPQTDPALYYPPLPALQRLADAPPGRMLGFRCLHPELPQTHRLHEVRGYDGVDPRRLVEVLNLARYSGPMSDPGPQYAVTAYFQPMVKINDDGRIELPGVLDMLDVRYLVFQAPYPFPQGFRPSWEEGGYAVVENPRAAGRVYVPRRAEHLEPGEATLKRLAAPGFDPRAQVIVDQPPAFTGESKGAARVTADSPGEVEIAAEMETPGLVVLADQWYEGWSATVDGVPRPIIRANHSLRGVEAPAGRSVIRFRYDPDGFVWGVRLFIGGLLGMLGWCAWMGFGGRRLRAAES